MLLQKVYTASSSHQLESLALPDELDLGHGVTARFGAPKGTKFHVTTSRQVDPAHMEPITHEPFLADDLPVTRIRLNNDDPPETLLVRDLFDAIAFLSDSPLGLSRAIHLDRFVAEDAADADLLRDFGSDEVHEATRADFVIRSFIDLPVTADVITPLLGRRPGIRLYSDALRSGSVASKYRDLWRILESAFRCKDDKLVQALLAFPPVAELGIDKRALDGLMVLRGRASHAESRGGIDELILVEHECAARMPTLKRLAERVILTKKSWGYPSPGMSDEPSFRPYPPN